MDCHDRLSDDQFLKIPAQSLNFNRTLMMSFI